MEMTDEINESLGRSYGMPELDDADLEAGMCVYCVGVIFNYNNIYVELCI